MSSDDDHITVDFATLRNLSIELEDILRKLNEKLDLLYGRVEKVVLTWDGEARQAFVDELDKWDLSAQDLEAAQAWLHEIVVNGHINYAAAHKSVLHGWGAT
ncbi:WXG100 family type VII secretion target [Streptomyces lunaelactis]|uniref:WXG100 family type VII secretion target n=1 Tax=Streptomyces lunaelactis TaxID=1535768 RepID=UPI0015852BCD|nr:WXG100 family type VII secretion target [Streptomyces lunaelactis]NUK54483.1 WXG100 family type VII secretion target [Streptomyces lunaelactis]NUK68434.1 WXG100 family type VII secretion target [Streptomyces lunaelactis]